MTLSETTFGDRSTTLTDFLDRCIRRNVKATHLDAARAPSESEVAAAIARSRARQPIKVEVKDRFK
jgi:hypothetical protein